MRLRLSLYFVLACAAVSALAMAGCARRTSEVDDAALRAADGDSADWLTYGRTYSEQRFSPLNQINEQSVGKLGLAWSYDLETLRGVEATPLVKDGVLYTTSAWSLVYAFDAATGSPQIQLLLYLTPTLRHPHLSRVGVSMQG
jgi:glucose dehydrogenase